MEEQLIQAMENLDEDLVVKTIQSLREKGFDYLSIQDLLNQGMQRVGDHFARGEYFLADLMVSGLIYRKVMEKWIEEHGKSPGKAGKILIGVMKDDIHDIGKDIVCSILRANDFEVIDLGVDVETERFVEAAKEHHPDIIALCGAMWFVEEEMQQAIALFEENGLRKHAKIIIGGACLTSAGIASIPADGYSLNASGAANLCRKIVENNG